ncbi:MAG TPA: phosphatidate cytidylyltransferase, partial [Chitinophagaceae bacterium]|nr:phosphatidate cytidylyltransferase [Chitinophagaceae bacterium]
LTALFSLTGDLWASYYKRKIKIKDYSNLLPGQGGFLDRFDSLLITGAFYFILYKANLYIQLFTNEMIQKGIGE